MIINENAVICVAEAIKELRPNAVYEMSNTQFTKWYDPDGLDAPSWDEVAVVIEKQKIKFDYETYARERSKLYPPIGEQLDMIWHALDKNIPLQNSEWFYKLKHIKESVAKP
jgi:hypothetical protein